MLLVPVLAHGQAPQGSGSPYSAYGLGEFVGSTQVSQATMGGLSVAVNDPVSVVSANPASYAGLRLTCFETGLAVRNSKYKTAVTSGTGRRVDLMGFSLGVPFGRGKYAMALGVNPVSKVGYNITDAQPLPGNSAGVTNDYTGDGGLNKAFLGLAWNIVNQRDSLNNGKRLAIGANVGYMFGRVEESRKTIYPASSGYYNTSAVSSLIMRDVTGNVGVQLQGDLRKHVERGDNALRYLAGASVELPTNLRARRTELVTSYGRSATGVEFPFDTLYSTEGSKSVLKLPIGVGVGFTIFDLHWSVSAEVKFKDWRDLRVNEGSGTTNTLAQSMVYAVGASWRPAGEVGGTFLERSIYRLGVRYNNDYLVVGGKQLNEIGMSFGISLPVMGTSTRSRLNLGAELGNRGTTENGLIQERYAAVFIGITITPDFREQWFKKRRIE